MTQKAIKTSVRETAINAVVEALEDMKGGVANGYNTQVQRVFRVMREPRKAGALPYCCVVDAGARLATGNEGAPHNFYESTLALTVWGMMKVGQDGDDVATPSMMLNRFIADIKRSLSKAATLQGGTVNSTVDLMKFRSEDLGLWDGMGNVGVCFVTLELMYLEADTVDDAVGRDGPYSGR